MRFMLLQNYGEAEGCGPAVRVEPGRPPAHIEFQQALNAELFERGELVDAQGLAGPDQAKFVVSDGASAPVITDGPFPESKELLAGYRIVDVETAARALEIAARRRRRPVPNGVPIRQPIEVRQVMSARRPRGVSTDDEHRGPAARARAAGPRCGRPSLRRLRRRARTRCRRH